MPEMPPEIADRDADVWEPLLAIADMAGGDWPKAARVAAVTLVTDSKAGTPSLGVRLLADIRAVFGDAEHLATAVLLNKLHALDESPWGDLHGKPMDARNLARRLAKYEIGPKSIRTAGGVVKGYDRQSLHDAWQRYLPPEPVVGSPPDGSVTSVTKVTLEANAPPAPWPETPWPETPWPGDDLQPRNWEPDYG
jgi:hypothetical protein